MLKLHILEDFGSRFLIVEMGTNYYLIKNLEEEQKKKLLDLIEQSKIGSLQEEINSICSKNIIHLGKQSCGWKFLWNPNMREVDYGHFDTSGVRATYRWIENKQIEKLYPLTQDGIWDFVMNDNTRLEDEYGSEIDKIEFLEGAFNSTGLDSMEYLRKHPDNCTISFDLSEEQKFWKRLGYVFTSPYQSDFYSDFLRFSTNIDFS